MRILRAKPYEKDLISAFYMLRFLKALVIAISILLPFIIRSEDYLSMYFLSSMMIFSIMLFFHYDDKLEKLKKIKRVYKQNEKIFVLQNKVMLKKDFFLRFSRSDLIHGKRITFQLNEEVLISFEVRDLLIQTGDNHFVVLFSDDDIENLSDLSCYLIDKNGEVISSKSLNHLFRDGI